MKVYFEDAAFDGQLLRSLGYAYDGGADIGECLTTAQRITPGDRESWYREWTATADRVFAAAETSRAAGRAVSAREAYLRASNYYRTAYVFQFVPPLDPRAVAALDHHTAAFRQAAALFTPAFEPVTIPYEDTTLPGYFLRAPGAAGPRPTLLMMSGYDGTAEETYLATGAAALRRGYHCLAFDGPGQGAALFHQQLVMRPDWEAVITPLVDYLLTRPEVDEQRIALIGRSWGGYLAPRAATAEHRLAACVADPGQYAPAAQLHAMIPGLARGLVQSGPTAVVGPLIAQAMRRPALAFTINRGMLVHGYSTPLEYIRGYAPYTLEGLADRITCPTLVAQAENDTRASQAEELYYALTCPRQLVRFSNAEGAGEHCEAGADSLFAQRIFDWLDEVLGVK